MIPATFRPIDNWPGAYTPDSARKGSPFEASYSTTLDLLERELDHLGATDIVIQVALPDSAIRNDGWPKANAPRPSHPGVIVSFESDHGPLRYLTDRFREQDWGSGTRYLYGWQANLRAIALGLEALRKVDRYGITKRGEQYTGWKALGSGGPIEVGAAQAMTADQAAAFIGEQAGWTTPPDPCDPYVVTLAYRLAAKRLHPDAGGDPAMFVRLKQAKDVLDRGAR